VHGDPFQRRIASIPFFAVDQRFHGVPAGAAEGTFASEMFQDLLAEARALSGIQPHMGLKVDMRNERGIRFWTRMGFQWLGGRPDPPAVTRKMVLTL
jgi:ribosomal protein S18 acetylase RimI-like enzyme